MYACKQCELHRTVFSLSFTVNLNDVLDISDPMKKVKPGLQASGGDVPLKSVHIKARLLDLAAKVCLCGPGA